MKQRQKPIAIMNVIKRFASEKSPLIGCVFLGIILLLTSIVFISPGSPADHPGVILAVSITPVFLIWIWFYTSYAIDDSYVRYASGPFRGKIPVEAIREIIRHQSPWYGFRPALARNGVIIKYDRWEEIYMSPKDQDLFIAELTRLNPAIVVK